MEDVEIFFFYHFIFEKSLSEPADERIPELGAEHHDREVGYFVRLHQCEGFRQLVEGAESAWKRNESLGIAREHRLADVEIVEVDAFVAVDVRV